MTIEKLFRVLELAIHDGYGEAEILFDTEAKSFDYHMAKIGSAYMETEAFPDRPFLWLGEDGLDPRTPEFGVAPAEQ